MGVLESPRKVLDFFFSERVGTLAMEYATIVFETLSIFGYLMLDI